jgi:hypothetical protein
MSLVRCFFLIELDFVVIYFFPHIVKKIVSAKIYVIKLHKVYEPIYDFGWLTWFESLTSLTFFYFISSMILG